MERYVEKILGKMKFNKKTLLAGAAVIGVILVAVGSVSGKVKERDAPEFDEKEYISQLERRAEQMVSQISGAGDSKVVINIASSTETVYVRENKRSYDSEGDNSKGETEDSVLTMTDGSGNQYAVVKKQIMPEICGVTVLCDGGGDKSVCAAVVEAVSTLLGVGSNKVCVIAKNK